MTGIANSRVVSHSMRANVLWVNERAGAPQLLQLGQRSLQLRWKPSLRPRVPGRTRQKVHINKAGAVRSRIHLLQSNTQTKRHFPWLQRGQDSICAERKRKGVGFFSTPKDQNQNRKPKLTYFGHVGSVFNHFISRTKKTKDLNWCQNLPHIRA